MMPPDFVRFQPRNELAKRLIELESESHFREQQRQEIAQQTAEYEQRGGRITHLPCNINTH